MKRIDSPLDIRLLIGDVADPLAELEYSSRAGDGAPLFRVRGPKKPDPVPVPSRNPKDVEKAFRLAKKVEQLRLTVIKRADFFGWLEFLGDHGFSQTLPANEAQVAWVNDFNRLVVELLEMRLNDAEEQLRLMGYGE